MVAMDEDDSERFSYYEIMTVADLPPSKPFRADCMGVNYRGRPRRFLGLGKPCCWYHDQSWAAISETAISLIEEAGRAGIVEAMKVFRYAEKRVGVAGRDAHAVYELLCPAVALLIGPSGYYTNGQHRGQAMKDLGVRRTIALRWREVDTTDGVRSD